LTDLHIKAADGNLTRRKDERIKERPKKKGGKKAYVKM